MRIIILLLLVLVCSATHGADKLQVVDAGSANIRLENENADSVRLQVSMPQYKFPKPVEPELIIVNPRPPKVSLNGKPLSVTRIAGASFYRCPLTEDGTCVVSR